MRGHGCDAARPDDVGTGAVRAGARGSSETVARRQSSGASPLRVGRTDHDHRQGRGEEAGRKAVLLRRGREGPENAHSWRVSATGGTAEQRRPPPWTVEGRNRREEGR